MGQTQPHFPKIDKFGRSGDNSQFDVVTSNHNESTIDNKSTLIYPAPSKNQIKDKDIGLPVNYKPKK